MKREYEQVETNFIKFEEIGQAIEGEITDIDVSTSEDFSIYTVKDDNGVVRRFHDSKQLRNLLLQCNIGDYIKVAYVDTEHVPNGELKIFTVEKSK